MLKRTIRRPGRCAARTPCTFEGLEGRRLLSADAAELLRDINPGGGDSSRWPDHPINAPVSVNGRVVFVAEDVRFEAAIWGTDGTPAGTTRLLDLSPAGTWAKVGEVKKVGDKVFFLA